jgi:predicted DCC family thiol-disulfide oxidoreductase YuxK
MAIRSPVAAVAARSLTVWFAGGCPICTAAIGLLSGFDRGSSMAFVDLSLPDACPSDRDERLARLHAQVRGGSMVACAAAFVAMWRVLPARRPLAVLASSPPVLWLLELAYTLFLRLRPALQATARWILVRRGRGGR